jgi:lipopolysaccharide transport system ATP-binding protein
MSDTIIQIENLGKKYILHHRQNERHTSLRDVISGKATSILRRVINPVSIRKADPRREEFWALKDVSFRVNRGEVIGIIGRNGAGKSTLLKLLSRITEPTTGRIRIKGRVASLLEVGTGFHPELTGRENIYLNGAILGMEKTEIKRKFDEIVAFAEIDKFLDTPVKRFSSGMYVRLAFAVAAFLEPDILVIDEVLAVGDIEFQRKCLGRMNRVADEGRTVLFVSHNLSAVRQLCKNACLLENGTLKNIGGTDAIVDQYLKSEKLSISQNNHSEIFQNKKYEISLFGFKCALSKKSIDKHTLKLQFSIQSSKNYRDIGIGLKISDQMGITVCKIAPMVTNFYTEIAGEASFISIEIPLINLLLPEGRYYLGIWLSFHRKEIILNQDYIGYFELPGTDIFKSGVLFNNQKHGSVILPIVGSVDNKIIIDTREAYDFC